MGPGLGNGPKCKLKKPNAFQITENCSWFPLFNKSFGFTFKSEFEFEDCCECCEFRQYIVENSLLVTLKSGKTIDIPYIDNTSDPKEDCEPMVDPVTKQPILGPDGKQQMNCYGHRDNPVKRSDNVFGDCRYKMDDTPLYPRNFLLQQLSNAKVPFDDFASVSIKWVFHQSIVDTCNGGGGIWRKELIKSCKISKATLLSVK